MGQAFDVQMPQTTGVPSVGLLLVHGANGAGKSSRMVDAPCYAFWGKTERGVDPWSTQAGFVSVETDAFTITRRWTGKSLSVRLTDPLRALEFSTNTSASAEVCKRYMTLDAWKLCARLTSNDIAAFSRAAAAKELSMLESVLGLSWVKKASAAASAKHREAQTALAEVAYEQKQNQQQVAHIEHTIALAEMLLGETPEPPPFPKPTEQYIADLRLQIAGNDSPTQRCLSEQHVDGSENWENCPTCKRPWRRVSASGSSQETVASRQHESALAAAARTWHLLDTAKDQQVAWTTYESAVRSRQAKLQQLNLPREHERLLDALCDAMAIDTDLQGAQKQAEIAAAVHQLYSAGGVRELLLKRALSQLAQTATGYAAALGLGHTSIGLDLRADNGKIEFSATGVGGKHGYDGASSGQRRRIDIAMALAMADNSRYGKRGTLWLDEVFDSLDEDGIDQVVNLVSQLSQQRQVILLTHNYTALQMMRPTATQVMHLTR